jgi:hypothetical protein
MRFYVALINKQGEIYYSTTVQASNKSEAFMKGLKEYEAIDKTFHIASIEIEE